MKSVINRYKASLVLFVGIAWHSGPAFSSCSSSDFVNWSALMNYSGTIAEKYPIQMTLVVSGEHKDQVEGIYFYQSQLKDIQLRGRLLHGTDLELSELDASGNMLATFDAKFVDKDPKGRFGSNNLQCEVIVGTWRKEGKEALPVYLALNSANGGRLHHRYAVAGADDDELIDTNARRFWAGVKKGDKKIVSDLIDYPITVKVKGISKQIDGPVELVSNYDAIFTVQFREAISKSIPKNMFARDQGIMLGNGEVWFGPNGKVIALNN